MDTNEHASSQTACGGDKDVAIGLNLTGIRSLKTPGPGAVAHMSLHQKLTMSKSHQTLKGGQQWSPDFYRGTGYPFHVGDQLSGAVKNRQRRVGERPYMCGLESGQRLFALLFQESWRTADFRGFPADLVGERWGGCAMNTRPDPLSPAHSQVKCVWARRFRL